MFHCLLSKKWYYHLIVTGDSDDQIHIPVESPTKAQGTMISIVVDAFTSIV